MNDYVKGFIDSAKSNGVSERDAMNVLKAASAADPAVAQQAQLQAGVSAPGPESLGGGQPPMPGGEGGGLPPELEQLINSLPPELLEQLLQEVSQELQGGEGGQGGPPPGPPGAQGPGGDPNMQGMGGPPPDQGFPKQGSADDEFILAKTAEYKEGFASAARAAGLNYNQANDLYKSALSQMEENPIDLNALVDSNEKRASHYEGFVTAAMNSGFRQKDAIEVYNQTFLN